MNINRRQVFFSMVFVIAALVCFGILLVQSNKYKDYISIDAKVVNVYKYHDINSDNYINYVDYEFEYQSKTVKVNKRVLFRLVHSIGSTETIRFDPNDPFKLENTYFLSILKIGGVSCFIMAAAMFLAFKK